MHGLPSSQPRLSAPGTQVPPEHPSPTVHASPSLQASELATCTQPLFGSQESVVQGSPSSQFRAGPGTHAPLTHVSPLATMVLRAVPPVHALPSLQPAEFAVCWQPACVSHASSVHGLPSSQETAAPATQLPPEQTSPTVHTDPSEHGAVLFTRWQPKAVSQVSVVQGLPSSQALVPVGLQAPAVQVSPVVQLLLSVQGKVLSMCLQPVVAKQLSSVHGLPSSQDSGAAPTQTPLAQVSMVVHASPSLHGSAFAVFAQPPVALQVSVVQRFPSSQLTTAPGTQLPPAHASAPPTPVHKFPSLHGKLLKSWVQPPLTEQASVVHGLPSSHVTTTEPLHTPPKHTSLELHAFPSSQDTVLNVFAQPVDGAQVSVVQRLLSLQSTAAPGVHLPAAHASAPLTPVHKFPSLQGNVLKSCVQPPPTVHVSVVQALPSSHVTAAPGLQTPPTQTSPLVHASPSLHARLLPAWTQPASASQVSVVQGFASEQSWAGPGTQLPPAHLSPTVHALLSVQASALLLCTQPSALSHVSTVHGLPSSHASTPLPAQVPAEHASPVVHALPSSHANVLKVCAQPLAGSQVSVVQANPSSQLEPEPGTHAPPLHASPVVHALLSLQDAVLALKVHPSAASQPSLVHGLPSLHCKTAPPLHNPPLHTSPVVHALPSEHGSALFVCQQPVVALQLSVVQSVWSSQPSAAPAMQPPSTHVSVVVHTLPSLQGALFIVCWQPCTALHVSSVHTLPSLHAISAPGLQPPPEQTSPPVHALPSSQATEFAAWTQPCFGLQLSLVHTFASSQSGAGPGTHAPPMQASPLVHALPSEQSAPFAVFTQPPPAVQLSVVQGLPSSQLTPLPGWHAPPEHTSPTVHTDPSLQGAALLLFAHPFCGLQASVVHTLPSSHVVVVPGKHTPPLHTSPTVQALASEHGSLVAPCWQPATASQLSLVQGFPSSHDASLPLTHAPPEQASPTVHTLPSSQGSVFASFEQPPAGSHRSVVQALPSSQPSAAPGTHWPAAHKSPFVQALLSVQVAVLALNWQPFCASHASSVHKLPSSHTMALPDTQPPFAHASPSVQTVPSLQGSVLLALLQPPLGSQVSVVQGFLSSQLLGALGVHTPFLHVSPVVQLLLSLHGKVLSTKRHPSIASHASSVHGLPSAHLSALPPTQAPLLHASNVVQTLPSSQGRVFMVLEQPVFGLQLSVVHRLSSLHVVAVPGRQLPPLHASPTLHALPSEHSPVFAVCEQPVAFAQASVVQGFPSSHAAAAPPLQAPALQASNVVQASPSSQASAFATLLQPVLGSQASVVHEFSSLHVVVAPGRQAPPLHASPAVQTLPSEQAAVFAVDSQPLTLSQASSVHGLPSEHTTALPAEHVLFLHTSPLVQASLSEHGAAFAFCWQPSFASQLSSVHTFTSSHTLAAPGTQAPLAHASPTVHTLPSVQVAVLLVKTQPSTVSHLSSVHGLPSSHTSALPPLHAFAAQTSFCVHALPSSQGSVLGACWQLVVPPHKSVVHKLPSSQFLALPGMQTPSLHASFSVHVLPSEQGSVFLTNRQPPAGSQASSVHGLPSLHNRLLPPKHAPPLHFSPLVHALPS